jgi:hypothetical protein
MKPFNNSFATIKLREEQSSFDEQNVTGADGAYNASLHASKKQRNPFTEDELSGYKKLKGFRPGHTKDTGGFQYSDLWGVNEGFEVGDSAKVTMKGNVNYNKIGEIVDVTKDGKYYTLQFKNNTKAIYHESDISTPAKVKDFQDKPSLPLDEEGLQEVKIPENIKSFAKRKQIIPLVMQVARWAEKAGKNIAGGTAIGKNYSTLVLDLTREGGEIHINTEDETIEVNGNWVDNYDGFLTALEPEAQDLDEQKYNWYKDEYIKENYHRFKKETITRSKEQQMHEAMKLVRKKLYEAEKALDYVKTMKEELGLQEYKSHTNKLMEKLQVSISEIYKKYKSIK